MTRARSIDYLGDGTGTRGRKRLDRRKMMENPGRDSSAGSGFRELLERLDPDPERAKTEFDRLRRTLTKFFDWRGAAWPEDCADETLDRLAGKMQDGVTVLDVGKLARGIARLVLLEDARAGARLAPLEAAEGRHAPARDDGEEESLLPDLERCLDELSRDGRELVLAYYAQDGRGKIEERQRLARDRRVSDNALRSRVQRLRDRLEDCVRQRSAGGAPAQEGS